MKRITSAIAWLALLLVVSGQAPAPPNGAQLLRQAQELLDSARYEPALERAQAALLAYADSSNSARGQCLLLLGNIFLETGQWDAAGQQFRAALRLFERGPDSGRLNAAQAHNNLGEYFYKKSDYARAEQEHRRALQLRTASLGNQHELIADSYNNLGNCRVALGDYAGAIRLHAEALAVRQALLPAQHPDRATSHNNLGNCAYLTGDFTTAQQHYEQALAIRRQVFGADHPKTAQVLNNLGNACAALGRQQAAIDYYEQALRIRRRIFGEKHPAVANALENIADLYTDQGDPITALDLYRQAYAIQSAQSGAGSPAAASLWHKIGLCYQYEGDYARARRHHAQALDVLTQYFGAGHPDIAGLYNNLGNCLAEEGALQAALNAYREALRIFNQNRPIPHAGIARVYNNTGTACLEAGQAGAALDAFEQALRALQAGPNAGERAVYLKNKGLALEKLGRQDEAAAVFAEALAGAEMLDPAAQLEIRLAWASLLCRRQLAAGDHAALNRTLPMLEQALQFGDSLRNRLQAPGSRQHWLDQRRPALQLAMEACYRLWKTRPDTALAARAFALAERNQSLYLLEQIHKEQARRFAGIPDSLLDLEQNLGERLNWLEKACLAAQQPPVDTATLRSLELQRADARQALQGHLRELETTYPDYYRLLHDRRTATTDALRRNLLKPGHALIAYFQADSALYFFVLTDANLHFEQIALDFPLVDWVRALRGNLQGYPTADSKSAALYARRYAEAAHRLYTKIFAPLEAAVSLPERLTLVPDGALAYLPFECLLTELPADPRLFKQHAYLLRRYQIAYAHSATQQLALLQQPAETQPKPLLAVAPEYANMRFGLRPLHNNRAEAQAISTLFQGDLLEGAGAGLSRFLQDAGQYSILLLAAHGQAGNSVGELSYLAFSTTDSTQTPFLYARDLYHRRIPAGLVVLSACETGLGDYRSGQGVVSLAKAFFHAGARSVASSLWSIDDAKSAALTNLFFKNLHGGLPKDAALRRAKLDFIAGQAHDDACPVYWAALTAYGDMAPLDETGGVNWWSVLLPALAAAAFFWWRRRKRRSSDSIT